MSGPKPKRQRRIEALARMEAHDKLSLHRTPEQKAEEMARLRDLIASNAR